MKSKAKVVLTEDEGGGRVGVLLWAVGLGLRVAWGLVNIPLL